jgi:LysM repeat protein
MKNRIALIFCLICTVSYGYSQSPQLKIEGTQGKFYLTHTVVAKENWYSIGRLFNCPPHDIASFNNMNFDKPLEVATVLNIPLTSGNFDQKQLKTTGESLIPVYHEVGDKEWMYKISSIYNDVPVTSLERWNNIKRDDVKKGTVLIVGYLKVKTDLSPLAMGISTNPVIGPATADGQVKTLKTSNPASIQPGNKPTQTSPTATVSQPPAKPPVSIVPNTTTSTTTAIPVNNPSERMNNYAVTHSNGGFFSIDYTGAGKSASGMAGTFKSTSGWTDGKYYALMNGITVGSIIRVTATNGKTVYAKVLGQLPDMKESAGLLIRISNAASAELGLGEGKYSVDVKY